MSRGKCKVCNAGPGMCFHGWQYDMANRVMEDSHVCLHGTGHGISEHIQLRNTIAAALVKARALPKK